MNFREITILGTLAIGLFACGGSEQATETTNVETNVEESTEVVDKVNYTVNTDESTVAWSGGTAGVQVYGHNGVIAISEGSLELEGDVVTSGSITIDMTTIEPLDEAYSEESPKEKLVGHLSSGDFFLVEEYPTSTFVINSMDGNTITGDLTIRGKTNTETVTNVVIESSENGVKASGKLVFDRQKYDVAWKHFMQDVVLADEIELNIELVATK